MDSLYFPTFKFRINEKKYKNKKIWRVYFSRGDCFSTVNEIFWYTPTDRHRNSQKLLLRIVLKVDALITRMTTSIKAKL